MISLLFVVDAVVEACLRFFFSMAFGVPSSDQELLDW